MALKKTDYSYYRELFPEAAANCYTGSISRILKLQGKDVPESAIWIAGNGFRLREGTDDYGYPRISFDLLKTVEDFCVQCGCTLKGDVIQADDFEPQLRHLLKSGSLIVWVNSKHLKYSDLYYSEQGYLHAILLEKMIDGQLIRIQDSLIVSTPAASCIADFHMLDLKKAVLDDLKTPELPVMGMFLSLQIQDDDRLKLDLDFLIRNLYANTAGILDGSRNQESDIMNYHKRCEAALAVGSQEEKIWQLRRINTIIKTLYVLPNRKLFYQIIPALQLKNKDGERLFKALGELVDGWLILANFCLKCAVQKDLKGLNILGHYFSLADGRESEFWTAMEVTLRQYI